MAEVGRYTVLSRFELQGAHVAVPERAARLLDPAFPVFRDPRTGKLVCHLVDRLDEGVGRLREPDRQLTIFDGAYPSLWLRALLPPEPDEFLGEETRAAVLTAYAVVIAQRWRYRKELHEEHTLLWDAGDERGISSDDVKVEAVTAGLYLAYHSRGEYQQVKMGERSLSRWARPSMEFEIRGFFRWLWARALKHARSELRAEVALQAQEPGQDPEDVGRDEPGADALNILLEREHEEAIAGELDALLTVASKRQAEILHALLVHLAEGYAWGEAQDRTADDLGMSPSTVRVQIHRLRQKVVA